MGPICIILSRQTCSARECKDPWLGFVTYRYAFIADGRMCVEGGRVRCEDHLRWAEIVERQIVVLVGRGRFGHLIHCTIVYILRFHTARIDR